VEEIEKIARIAME